MLDEAEKPATEGIDSVSRENGNDKARFDELARRIEKQSKRSLTLVWPTGILLILVSVIMIFVLSVYGQANGYLVAGAIIILFVVISYSILTYLRPAAGGDGSVVLRSAGPGPVAYAAHGDITMGYSAEQVSEIIKQIAPASGNVPFSVETCLTAIAQ
jgi:amino acid transporter